MARDFVGADPGITIDGEPVYAGYQTAEQTSADTTNFTNLLSVNEDTVQKALDVIDKLMKFIDGGRADEVYTAANRNIDGGGA